MAFSFNSLLLIRRKNRISSSLELLASTSVKSSKNSSTIKKKIPFPPEAIEFRFANFACPFRWNICKKFTPAVIATETMRLNTLLLVNCYPSDLGSSILIHIHPKGTRTRLRSMQRLWIGHAPSQTFCVCIVLRFRTPLNTTNTLLQRLEHSIT